MTIYSEFSHEKNVIFHSYVNVYQRVTKLCPSRDVVGLD